MPQAAQQHAFKGFDDWVEVFRAGTHVDSRGVECTFATADLDQIVVNGAKFGPAPAVLGHPKHNDPAYGWGTFKREGEILFAKFADVHPAFEAGVKSGAYRNRSIRVRKDPVNGWRADHVGWLGAAPPAIDGLKPVEFAADQADLHEFSAEAPAWDTGYALADVATVLRGLRDHLIATVGIEAADAAVPDWRITSINDAASRVRATPDDDAMGGVRPFTAPAGATTMLTQADLDRAVQETEARVRTELAAQQTAEFTAATDLANRLLAERRAERIATQINGWKAAGQLLPAEEAGLAEFMAALEGGQSVAFEFTAAGATPTKKTPVEFFADFVAARGRLVKLGAAGGADLASQANPDVVSFTAQPGYEGLNVDGDRAALDTRIKQYMAEHKCDYVAAAAAVMVIPSKA